MDATRRAASCKPAGKIMRAVSVLTCCHFILPGLPPKICAPALVEKINATSSKKIKLCEELINVNPGFPCALIMPAVMKHCLK